MTINRCRDLAEQLGTDIAHAPQPYGRDVAEYIHANGMHDVPYLLAHALRTIDELTSRTAQP